MSIVLPRNGALTASAMVALMFMTSCTRADDVRPVGPTTLSATTTVTLAVTEADGQPATADQVRRTREVLALRIAGAGWGEPQIDQPDPGQLTVTLSGVMRAEAVSQLVAPARLTVRKVLESIAQDPAATSPRNVDPTPTGPVRLPNRSDVLAKLGPALPTALGIRSPMQVADDPTLRASLEPFASLTPSEVAVLDHRTQFLVPQVGCAALNLRPVGLPDTANAPLTACSRVGEKHLLDVERVTNTDIASASAALDAATSLWTIRLTFTAPGAQRWSVLTGEAFAGDGCTVAVAGQHCRVAIVVDQVVFQAPTMTAPLLPDLPVGANLTQQSAQLLAAQLQAGAFPVIPRIVKITSRDSMP